ncbi:MAG: SGNH/GDSL hydrolase family protein [Gordonia sp. (in: high G+C Gram-positive bacteria)]
MRKREGALPRSVVARNGGVVLILLLAVGLVTVLVLRSGGSQEVAREINAGRSAPTTTAASTERTREVAVIGDSYTSGSAVGGRGDRAWPRIVAQLVKRQVPNAVFKIAAMGGSGYVAQGRTQLTFNDQVRRVVSRNTDVVVIFGSRNDLIATNDELEAAVTGTLTTVRSLSPGANIILIGPAWVNEYPPGALLTQRDLIAGVARQFGINLLDPVRSQWFTTRKPELVGSDNTHPNDAGHRMMASKIYPIVLSAIDPTAGMRN